MLRVNSGWHHGPLDGTTPMLAPGALETGRRGVPPPALLNAPLQPVSQLHGNKGLDNPIVAAPQPPRLPTPLEALQQHGSRLSAARRRVRRTRHPAALHRL